MRPNVGRIVAVAAGFAAPLVFLAMVLAPGSLKFFLLGLETVLVIGGITGYILSTRT